MKHFLLPAMLAMTLAACGEKDQSLGASASKSDEKVWAGAHDPFVVKGWSPGDQTSWHNQIRARMQYQNEYVKSN